MKIIERIAVLETKIDYVMKMLYGVLLMLAAQFGMKIDVGKIINLFGLGVN